MRVFLAALLAAGLVACEERDHDRPLAPPGPTGPSFGGGPPTGGDASVPPPPPPITDGGLVDAGISDAARPDGNLPVPPAAVICPDGTFCPQNSQCCPIGASPSGPALYSCVPTGQRCTPEM